MDLGNLKLHGGEAEYVVHIIFIWQMRDKCYRRSPQQFSSLSFTCWDCFNRGKLAVLQVAQGTDHPLISPKEQQLCGKHAYEQWQRPRKLLRSTPRPAPAGTGAIHPLAVPQLGARCSPLKFWSRARGRQGTRPPRAVPRRTADVSSLEADAEGYIN